MGRVGALRTRRETRRSLRPVLSARVRCHCAASVHDLCTTQRVIALPAGAHRPPPPPEASSAARSSPRASLPAPRAPRPCLGPSTSRRPRGDRSPRSAELPRRLWVRHESAVVSERSRRPAREDRLRRSRAALRGGSLPPCGASDGRAEFLHKGAPNGVGFLSPPPRHDARGAGRDRPYRPLRRAPRVWCSSWLTES